MKEGKKKSRISAILSLFLAVAISVGSLPLMGFDVKAAAEQKETANQIETEAGNDSRFKHPGMMHSAEDLAKAWENVQNNVAPNKATWDALWGNTWSNPNWNPRPVEEVTRGVPGANIGQLCIDLKRAYQNALIWKLSGDKAHGDTAVRVVNGWSSVMKRVGGSQDRFLVSGLQGYQLANIGELLRDHPDFDLKGLQNLLIDAFYPLNQDFMIRHNDTYVGSYWANWELANIASMISIGVFCDREDIYEQALNFFKYGKGNGSFYHAMPYVLEQDGQELVQWQESVRDQGHTTLGLTLVGVICETAWNQGDDLYGLSDNRFMKAAEYAIKCNNLGEQEVPSTWYMRVSGNLRNKPTYEFFAGVNRWPAGSWRPIYYQMYNHYVNRKGVEMPNAAQMIQPETGTYIEGESTTNLDELGWYSLTYANTGRRVEDKPIQGELSDGVYRIVSSLSGKSLVTNAAGELVSAPKGSSKDEWWLVKNNGDGEYTITSMSTGKAVQINGEGTEVRNVGGTDYTYSRYYLEGPAVGTGEADGSRKQHFAFLKDDDGLFRIVPSMTYYVWGLEGDNSGDNVKVIQWFNNAAGQYNNDSTPGQRWTFEKATEVGTEFTFDDTSTGFTTTYAEAEGTYTLQEHQPGKAVSLNGTSDFLTIKAKTEKSVLAGETAFTVTCEVKPEAGNDNWIFYASPEEVQESGQETYLGIKETDGIVTAVAYKNGQKSASVHSEGKEGWYQVSAVYDGAEIILYINGQEKGRQTGSSKISDIVTEHDILQIGKANLETEKYYKGLIDNFKITGHAMTEGEVIKAAGDYAMTEIEVPETLVDLNFDDVQTGFAGGAATAKGVYSLADHNGGKALYLNGDKDYLKITGMNRGSVIPGGLVKEMTVSLQAKRDGGEFGWVFYAAPDDNSPTFGWEKYLGISDNGDTVTAQRFYNQGERLPAADAQCKSGRWHYLTIVYKEDSIIVYVDGEKKAETANNAALSEILGGDSVWYIGKANWKKAFNREKGEHFRGWIDNYKVVSRAWTDAEVKTEARKYVDKSILQNTVENQKAEEQSIYTADRWQTYQSALAKAKEVLADRDALQNEVDSAEEPLSRVQAWMRMDEALYAAVPENQEAMYTAKTWEPYVKALSEAKTLNENKEATNSDLQEAAKKLREALGELLKKTETVLEAVNRINDIGTVELTPECSRKVILARQICDLLTQEELEHISNLSELEAAETAMIDYLAEFTFDDEETGFIGGQAIAEGQGAYTIRDGALYLDGSNSNWLNITKGNGSSLLTGRTELTLSFAAKPESEKGNWLFYASPNGEAQEVNYETYLGLFEYQGDFSAERYKNNGARPEAAFVEEVDTSDWMYVTVVHTAGETVLYINGKEAARKESSIALPDLLGENSILQIGKANWGNGEYYKGYLDNVKILGTAMSAEAIKAEAESYLDNIVEQEEVNHVIAKIKAIGEVELSNESKAKIEQARSAYDKLSAAEKKLVANADVLFLAESRYQELADEIQVTLAEFTFDDKENGFRSSNAVTKASNTPVIVQDETRGKVLCLDGSGNVWLNVTKKDETPLLTDTEEVTISYYSKAGRSGTNWAFYAAPNENGQILGKEYYIGIMESGSKVTAERFLNGRQDSAEASYEEGWNHIAVVYGKDNTKVYVNGTLTNTVDNNGSLRQILGEDSILQIGKANWGDGEYYQGLLDDFAIYNYACSERQVQILAGVIANPKEIKDKITEAKGIEEGNYTAASYQALQEAIQEAWKAYNSVTTEEEAAAAAAALQKAMDELVNCTELKGEIAEAKGIEKGNYTNASYEALQEAIREAERVLREGKTQSELKEAQDTLQRAIDGLIKEESADSEEFERLVKELKGKIAEAKGIEKGNYTDVSYEALQEAIWEAEKTLIEAKTQSEVREVQEMLQKAIDGLKEKEATDPEEPDKSVKELKLIPAQQKLTVGDQFIIQVIISPDDAEYSIFSSDSGVAEVSGTQITAKGAGRAVLTAAALDGSEKRASAVVEVHLRTVAKIKAVQQKTSRYVSVSFKGVKGAVGYDIYRSTNPAKGYAKIGSVTAERYVDKKVKSAKTYYYKVVSRAKDPAYNSTLSVQYAKVKVLARPLAKGKALKGRKVRVTWKKIKGAKGYVVYSSTKKNKGFKAVKTLKKVKMVKTTIKAKKYVKRLYIKVRPYYTEKKKRVYGPYSKTKVIRLKK